MFARKPSRFISIIGCVLFCLQVAASAVTLEELRQTSQLTPQKFAGYFSNFEFKFRGDVQSPDVFLATESGDCDDYATLASRILEEKGYTTRLVAVRLESVVHVVCYVKETGSYLDYNNRSFLRKTVPCGDNLNEIADKVAKSFDEKWTSASEFTYNDRMKRLVATVVETDRTFTSARKNSVPPKLLSLLNW